MHLRSACSFAAIFACFAAAGCPQSAKQDDKKPTPIPLVKVENQSEIKPGEKETPSAEAAKWGAVVGRIVWEGAIPADAPIDVSMNGDCKKHSPIRNETWSIHAKNKGLQSCFVWLAPKDAKDKKAKLPIHPDFKGAPNEPAVVDQPGCAFVPHALGMRGGQKLVVKNPAEFAHNFKYTGNPELPLQSGNPLLVGKSQKEIVGLVADRLPIVIECSIHPWMRGYIRVFDHPYFAVTDADGKFEIKNAPTGECRLMIWHGAGGSAGGAKGREGKAIEVKENSDLGDLTYPAPK
ncbi:MAG: hypothetical protein U0744_02985 [Gemmataceae bacterium]